MRRTYTVHISAAITEFIGDLERVILAIAERHGPLRGRVRIAQLPWSHALDLVEHERQLSGVAPSRLGLTTSGTGPRRPA